MEDSMEESQEDSMVDDSSEDSSSEENEKEVADESENESDEEYRVGVYRKTRKCKRRKIFGSRSVNRKKKPWVPVWSKEEK